MYAQVAVNVPNVSGIFDYSLPEGLAQRVMPGCLVTVPFGKQVVQGIVIRLAETTEVSSVRPVEDLLDDVPVASEAQLRLAEWLAEENMASLADCIHLMLPPGLGQHSDTAYWNNPAPQTTDSRPLSPLQERILNLFNTRGELRGRQLEAALPRHNWRQAVQGLVKRGRVLSRTVLPKPTVRPKVVRTVQLSVSPAMAEEQMEGLGRGEALKRRQEALRFLMKEALPVAVSWVYAASGCNLQDLTRLAESGLVVLGETEVWRDPLENHAGEPVVTVVRLTSEQKEAWSQIRQVACASDEGHETQPVLLHGVTGSGKTEIYLRTVEEVLAQGRQAIVLVPEISLTPQTVRRFSSRFPGQVGIMHSKLSPGERYDTWRRVRSGQLPVVIGPRSALFMPMPKLGAIIVDECHDDSYYQSEGQPWYHAVRAAERYAAISGAVLVYGSATPPVDLLYRAEQKRWPVLQLSRRVRAHHEITDQAGQNGPAGQPGWLPLPPVQVVDMRQELKAGQRSIFSRALTEALSDVLLAGQQAILFLNRRGSATYVFCRECGYVMRCPKCELPLTYHMVAEEGETKKTDLLSCHQCGYRRKMPAACPECGSRQIRYYGSGTEKVEQEVMHLFPHARTLRWDYEATRKKGSHELLLSHFVRRQADILIGTQMLAKGLDLPMVTLVGVVLADVGLNFPDYRAGERAFQLLTQVAGRAGRSSLGGRVIFQTFQPDHPIIRAAAEHDYERFSRQELEDRRRLRYPPYYHLVRLEVRNSDAGKAEDAARRMGMQLKSWIEAGGHTSSELIGPVPCFFAKVNGYYRWQVILRGPDPVRILKGKPLEGWRVEVDPPNLL